MVNQLIEKTKRSCGHPLKVGDDYYCVKAMYLLSPTEKNQEQIEGWLNPIYPVFLFSYFLGTREAIRVLINSIDALLPSPQLVLSIS